MSACGLTIETRSYPNPAYQFGIFRIGDREIGNADWVGQDQWVIRPGRKKRGTHDTAKELLMQIIRKARTRRLEIDREEHEAAEMMKALQKQVAK